MKLIECCWKCVKENNGDLAEKIVYSTQVIELDKLPYFEYTCSNNHINRCTLNLELYEILFQQATYCIQDSYFREAIGTYNACLERFLEFCIEILFYYSKIEADFLKLWNPISNQSERQLGAYYAIWTSTINEAPLTICESMVKLRNNVVHKGKLASETEAREFGKYVFDYIKNISATLDRKLDLEQLLLAKLRRWNRLCKDDVKKIQDINCKAGEVKYELLCINTICFLRDEKVVNYEDCFLPDNNYNNYGYLCK